LGGIFAVGFCPQDFFLYGVVSQIEYLIERARKSNSERLNDGPLETTETVTKRSPNFHLFVVILAFLDWHLVMAYLVGIDQAKRLSQATF